MTQTNQMPKVLIADDLSPRAAEIFNERGVATDVKVGLKPEELIAIADQYDGIAVRSATKITQAVLDAATKLKVVGRAGIGVDNVDIPAATARGVAVMNTPFGNSTTTAEHAISMMMALARQIPQASASTHAGKWEKSKFMGVELYGKTLGLIGCGNIGQIVADRAQGLKMKVVAFDPFLSDERARDIGVEKADLDTLFAKADFITLHTPLTEQTRNVINADAIKKMKPSVRIINCARGGLVNETDLKAALDAGTVAGAALDVFEVEPAKENQLFNHPNVICTPHLGASTNEAQENVALQVAEQMADYLVKGAVVNAINMPSVSAEDAAKLKPYMILAKQIGAFLGQTLEGEIKSITLEYQGHVASVNVRPLTSIALQSLLSCTMDSVNMVNAPLIAKERKIDVRETRLESAGDYQTLLSLTIETSRGKHSVAGSLFGGTKPRLVNIDGVPVEMGLADVMLFVRNVDKPGHIGRLGQALGDANINIANFDLGRLGAGEEAISLVAVDQTIPDNVLDKIRALPNVLQASVLHF